MKHLAYSPRPERRNEPDQSGRGCTSVVGTGFIGYLNSADTSMLRFLGISRRLSARQLESSQHNNQLPNILRQVHSNSERDRPKSSKATTMYFSKPITFILASSLAATCVVAAPGQQAKRATIYPGVSHKHSQAFSYPQTLTPL